MSRKHTRMAIAYDFDGTLAPGNMQEHSFIPNLNVTKDQFWKETKAKAKQHDMDEILAYMSLMLEKAKIADVKITRKSFKAHGKSIDFFPGVEDWFERHSKFAKERNIKLEHYIISSGLREMVEGTRIGSKFKKIFASGFVYDQHDVAEWPALAVNYTTKTQFLFRINKGIDNSYDNEQINKFIPDEDRSIPFANIAYIGDGETDVPCMKMLKYQGGCAIAVYNPKKHRTKKRRSAKEIALELVQHDRADYALPTDYTEGSELDLLVKALIDRVAATARMNQTKRAKSVDSDSKYETSEPAGTEDSGQIEGQI